MAFKSNEIISIIKCNFFFFMVAFNAKLKKYGLPSNKVVDPWA